LTGISAKKEKGKLLKKKKKNLGQVRILALHGDERYSTQHSENRLIDGQADLCAAQVAISLELHPRLGHFRNMEAGIVEEIGRRG
jgi:hypothetical protein